jgi:carboxyl-terminal processing protease
MRLQALCAAALVCALGGCASFDPHNILGRGANVDAAARPFGDANIPTIRTSETIRAERLRNVELVWTTIRDRYYRADFNGVDWQAVRTKWEPQIVDAPTDDEYWLRLDRMVAELGDAHTRVENPTQVEARRAQRIRSLGLGLREIEGKLVVTSVNPDADAFFAGIRPGMIITSIGAADALSTWRQWISQARKSSSEIATRAGALRKLTDIARIGNGIELEFERADGTRVRATLKLREISTRPSVSHRALPSGFGYVRLTAFSESLREELLRGIESMRETPALILDLRGNRGGSADMANALVGAFFKEKTAIGTAQTRSGKPVTIGFGAVQLIKLERSVPGRSDAYTGKVVVLIDNDSASASELVASALKATKRAQVIGETSCGCLLAFLGYARINGGGELAYSEVGFVDIAGNSVEKKGVQPDVAVSRSLNDIRDGRDRVLEAAVARLSAP